MIAFERSGMLTTVQDLGRTGYQSLGMPVSGAMDTFAMRLANILVDNDPGEAVLEITITGPAIRFGCPAVFAVCGAEFDMRINGAAAGLNKAIFADSGSLLEFLGIKKGARAYMAFSGGLAVKKVMGSCSTCIIASIGGIDGRALRPGDEIGLAGNRSNACLKRLAGRCVPDKFLERLPAYGSSPEVRFTYGPQDDMFSSEGKRIFTSSTYTVRPESNRMGYRLEGPGIEKNEGSSGNIISDGICFGSIQVTDGKPMVMMADRQTVGGYPKIGCVISADLPLLAQLKGGDSVRFRPVGIKEAQQAYLERERLLKDIRSYLDNSKGKEKHYRARVRGYVFDISLLEI